MCGHSRVSCGLQQGLAFWAGALYGEGARKIKSAFCWGVEGGARICGECCRWAGKSISDSNTSPVCPLTGGIMAACGKVVQLGSMGSAWTVERLSGCRFWPC